MKVSLATIKHLIKTGAAIDWTHAELTARQFRSTVIFYSSGNSGLNGLVLMDDENGQLYAVAGRVSNLFILAA